MGISDLQNVPKFIRDFTGCQKTCSISNGSSKRYHIGSNSFLAKKNVRIFRMQGNKNNLCEVTLEHARSD